jgi:hypothetical protein
MEIVPSRAPLDQHADFFWQIGQALNFFEARMAENRKH